MWVRTPHSVAGSSMAATAQKFHWNKCNITKIDTRSGFVNLKTLQGRRHVFRSYLLRHLQWQLVTDHGFLNLSTISKFDRAGFLIFGLVFVPRDFKVGINVSCEESTVSLRTGLIFTVIINSKSFPWPVGSVQESYSPIFRIRRMRVVSAQVGTTQAGPERLP